MAIALDSDQIQQILQGIVIPPQPQVMVDLQMEQIQPEPDLRRIAQLIRQDVGLSGTMLKVVNSASYGLANKITSVEQAVMLLGIDTVVNIVNGLSIKGELSDEDIVKMNRFWDAALDIAMVSQNIAKLIGYPTPDEAYTLGLFHNAGIPLMMKRFPDFEDTQRLAYAGEYGRIIDAENDAYRTNHAVIGYYTAKSWRVPQLLCDAIADHHSVEQIFTNNYAQDGRKKTLLAILKIAEHLCGLPLILTDREEDVEWARVGPLVFEYTGLGAYDLEQMRDTFRDMGVVSVINAPDD
ncbi:HDOD domain-containing protein [Saccharospirillum salsuginis]|uniref:HDOD domain-containing protein n=1 Tax=Saccharospirillum salsuginis TaxID=418750 RepID=A0A918NAR2_9GAMM|nr:HDOD domain-containing protein [Saccharospirillum salsuginis]GGX54110.1 HDOD domain-containing protein [Saccharospirillum salsuginis]